MKLLHVITSINRGGAENHLIELIAGQLRLGHEVRVAYLHGDGYWGAMLEESGVPVVNLGMRQYGDLRPLWQLRRLIAEFRPDVVHAHMPPAELYVVLARLGTASAAPLIISKHNDEPFYRGRGARLLGRWTAYSCSRMIAISSAVERYMAGPSLGVAPEKLTVVRYGIDAAPFMKSGVDQGAKLRDAWGIQVNERVIGTISRLVPQKAIHVMIEGFALFHASATGPTRLVIVGTGPLKEELRTLADRLGIADKVVWAGFQEDIPAVMASFDVFALTSIYEGFGLVLLEAMAAAKPVVATAVSAIPEVVGDAAGVLIPPNDPKALANALTTLEVPGVGESLGAAGRGRVLEEFSPQTMAERTCAIYVECLREHGVDDRAEAGV